MEGQLDDIIKKIVPHYQFNETDYPETKHLDENQRRLFGIRHLAQHFSKTAGKIVAQTEPIDHGGSPDFQELKIDVAKSLINTLRLAELIGMNEKDFTDFIDQKYKK